MYSLYPWLCKRKFIETENADRCDKEGDGTFLRYVEICLNIR